MSDTEMTTAPLCGGCGKRPARARRSPDGSVAVFYECVACETAGATIPPALAPERWREFGECVTYFMDHAGEQAARAAAGRVMADPDRPHECAALCLYGQPFGFTQEEREAVERAIAVLGYQPTEWHTQHTLRSALAKIAALLPQST